MKAPPIETPITGTKNPRHLEESVGAAAVSLTPEIVTRLDRLINQRTVAGPRYNETTQKDIDTAQIWLQRICSSASVPESTSFRYPFSGM